MPANTTYWGVQCKTCLEAIVLGIEEDPEFGDCLTFLQPGSFVCTHGHRHDYDLPDREEPLEPSEPVTRGGILANRNRYRRSTV